MSLFKCWTKANPPAMPSLILTLTLLLITLMLATMVMLMLMALMLLLPSRPSMLTELVTDKLSWGQASSGSARSGVAHTTV